MTAPGGPRRYEPLLKIASGGTAAVYVGAATGALGFRQLVAIKRPHAHLADDPAFCAALVEEARIASKLHHANLVDVRDVEVDESGIQLVMDYVEGASLSELIRSWSKEPPARGEAVALRIVLDACEGLGALHELTGDDGEALGLVHRDISPANVLVGLDGVARIADFGLAKPLLAVERTTSEGALRGKLGYMAPEYIRGRSIDRRIDVFAMGIVLWEVLARKRLFRGENDGDTLDRVQTMAPPRLADVAPELGGAAAALDAVIARALAKDPDTRLASVAELSRELEKVVRAHDLGATHGDVRDSFPPALRAELDDRRKRVQSATGAPVSQPPPAVVPVSQPPPAVVPSQPPPPASRSRRGLVAVGALVVIAGGVTLVAMRTSVSGGGSVPVAGAPHVVGSEVRPLAGEVRARDVGSTTTTEPSSATSRAGHAGPRTPPRPTSDEPGKKPPRPNPYASPAPPR